MRIHYPSGSTCGRFKAPAAWRCDWRRPTKHRNLMDLDEELCLCFHVTKRKVINFLRVEQPRRVGQLSECFGAGTGCGWCRPYLKRLFDAAGAGRGIGAPITSAGGYAPPP